MSDMKNNILNAVNDMVGDFLYYDRKNDEILPMHMIETQIELGNITVDDIIDKFSECLTKYVS